MNEIRRGLSKVTVAGWFAIFVLALAPTPAAADSGPVSVNTGAGWTTDEPGPLLNLSGVTPGWTGSSDFLIRNGSSDPTTLSIGVDHIVDSEDGCTPPEALVDHTCGADEGELGHAMVFAIYVAPNADGNFGTVPRWSGSIYDLASPITLAGKLDAHAVWGLRITAGLPAAAGNQTQSDQLGFGLSIRLDGSDLSGSVEVLGSKTTRHSSGGVVSDVIGALPFTGSDEQQLTKAALCLVIVGGVGLAVGSRRSRRAHTEV